MEILLYILIYAYMAYALQTIARKTNTENGWLAWIPILDLYLMCKIVGKPGWWVILFLIPIVNVIILIILWMRIAEARNKPSWLGILMILPVVNLVIPGILAFSDDSSQPATGTPSV